MVVGTGVAVWRYLRRWWLRATCREIRARRRVNSVDDPEKRERNRAGLADCVTRLAGSTWFEWSDSSRMHFWRLPERWRKEARDGTEFAVRMMMRSVELAKGAPLRTLSSRVSTALWLRGLISVLESLGVVRAGYFRMKKGPNSLQVCFAHRCS